ncbi:MAG TPA: thioredoxin family protein [Gammaproteobacteria bacterium]|nr:thioredoxin family protein [Gammaproteobacteria bacterium]
MAKTPSVMIELGTKAPSFSLLEPTTGKIVSLEDFTSKPILVAFICNHCPYVIQMKEVFSRFATEAMQKGLAVVAINANDVANYPADSPEKMIEDVDKYHYSFPYLYDETQEVAQAYQAACTPDFYLFDANHELYYRGQFDGARPGNDIPVTGKDMIAAVDALLANQPAPEPQLASLGCGIKWKQGNEPSY